jgi:hypothetical protein
MVTRAARALDDGAHELVNDWQTYATVQRLGFGGAQLIARSVPPNLRQALAQSRTSNVSSDIERCDRDVLGQSGL